LRDGLRRAQQALASLRDVDRMSVMLDRATEEVCRSCGFDRALLFRVQGGELYAESVCFQARPGWALEILELVRRDPPQLTAALLETELLRRRSAAMVLDAPSDPGAWAPLVEAMRTTSYVVAPVMPSGKVIGFIHADRYFQGREVDEHDRDLLWTFAEGFGYAVERTVLAERLRAQRDQLAKLMTSADAVMREGTEADVELKRYDEESATMAYTAAGLFIAPDPVISNLLTAREREVLQLLAGGATNAQIAGRLVISEATVKSHVKHLLRKLHAANRAEAVSRYMRIVSRG
jgi:DNA-binding CsgD family transcriptional regulator/GAF domain-containing protein